MKEIELPTKDIKTGAKVVGKVASNTFEAVKPFVARSLERKVFNLRKKLSK